MFVYRVVFILKAYAVTAYFTLLRTVMSEFFPFAIGTTAELLVSIKRIEVSLEGS